MPTAATSSADRLAPLRKAKHSVGSSRFSEAAKLVPGLHHGRVFSNSAGKDTTAPGEVESLIESGHSAICSFKSQNVAEVEDRARFFQSLGAGTTGRGNWIADAHYHEPEDLAETAGGPEAWLARQLEFSAIMHALAPNVVWLVIFTGEPGIQFDPDKPERHIYNFLPPDVDYPWLDGVGVDRYVHDVKRRPPLVAWGPVLAVATADYDRPLFVCEFGVEGTEAQRSQYVAADAQFVADQRKPGNKGKRILASTWFNSTVGPQAPTTYDGSRTWALDHAADKADTATPKAWGDFARAYPQPSTW